MRDLLIAGIIFGSIPFILRNPFIGILMWVWVSVMNPHRFGFGFVYSLPVAQIIALCTFVSMLLNYRKVYAFPSDRVSILLIVFVLWIGVSPWFSFHPEYELQLWLTPFKILFMTLVSLLLIGTRDQLHKLTWVLTLSLGFYGIKGGLFTLATAGNYRVWGPVGSFIEENNALALATIMTIPLFRYLQLHTENIWVRRGCLLAMVLCMFSALGSHSRGALLAMIAMGAFLFLKSRKKGLALIVVVVLLPLALSLMPEHWWERMGTIQTYDQDTSAMGRINAWWMAWNLAVDRFPIGGGFAIYEPDVFQRYAPDPLAIHAAHSIYFQVLGEHGFIGLALFLSVFGLTWLNAGWVVRTVRGRADYVWAHDLATMCQVSLAGYAVGGAFLSLTYFDLPYYIVVILIALRAYLQRELIHAPTPRGRNP
jgi:probable O-glycosylation ligase (exosortase A-associated)